MCNQQFAEDDTAPSDLSLVLPTTPAVWRRAVYRIACFFRREFQYDFVQYGRDGNESDPNAIAYIWSSGVCDGRGWLDIVYGACCFRLRKNGWALQWAWLHPYKRNQGVLREAWPFFRARFGAFDVEWPISDAMLAFLRKHQPDLLPSEL